MTYAKLNGAASAVAVVTLSAGLVCGREDKEPHVHPEEHGVDLLAEARGAGMGASSITASAAASFTFNLATGDLIRLA